MAGTVQRSLDGSLTLLPDGQRPDVTAPVAGEVAPVFSTRTPSGGSAPAVAAVGHLRGCRGSRHAWTGAAATAAAAALAVVVLGATDTPEPGPAAPAATVQEVPPRLSAGPHVRTGMLAASTWSGSATYRLFTTTPSATAIVALVRSGDRMRGDVTTGTTTATLLRADDGWVACSTDSSSDDSTECLLVASPGAPLPAAFDPGPGTLLTSVLPAMAGLTSGLTVTGALDPGAVVAAAQCAVVSTGPVPGEYCLTNGGLLRRAAFAGGKLNLTVATSTIGPTAFVPPATPVPLA